MKMTDDVAFRVQDSGPAAEAAASAGVRRYFPRFALLKMLGLKRWQQSLHACTAGAPFMLTWGGARVTPMAGRVALPPARIWSTRPCEGERRGYVKRG